MRRDMKHKIVERPRFNGYGNGNAIRRQRAAVRDMDIEELEELPTKQGMRRPHIEHWSGKELNENLNPLYRYLNKQEGRPWDLVYSEICEQIRPDSATQLHILQHVNDIVEINVIIVDGIPCYKHRAYWGRSDEFPPITDWNHGSYRHMYVDPRDGILKFAPKEEKLPKKKKNPNVFLSEHPLVQYHRIKGVWYQVNFRELEDKDFYSRDKKGNAIPRWRWRVIAHDMLAGKMPKISIDYAPSLGEWRWRYGDLIVPIQKRQLNSKEIKHLGLNEWAERNAA